MSIYRGGDGGVEVPNTRWSQMLAIRPVTSAINSRPRRAPRRGERSWDARLRHARKEQMSVFSCVFNISLEIAAASWWIFYFTYLKLNFAVSCKKLHKINMPSISMSILLLQLMKKLKSWYLRIFLLLWMLITLFHSDSIKAFLWIRTFSNRKIAI